MAHTHDDVHRDVEVIERDGGAGVTAGMLVAIGALIVFAIIALSVLYARPWDDNNSNNNTPNVPGISDNSGGGGSGSGDSGAPSGGGGSDSGGGGGDAPAQ